MKLSEVVQELIRLGDASQAYWDRELPKHHPRYPIVRDEDTPPPPPPEDAQIEALLRSLPEDQLYALMFLTNLGRGDFRADDLMLAYQHLKEALPTKELLIAQMTDDKYLGEYLADAIEKLQKRQIDLDHLPLASALAVI